MKRCSAAWAAGFFEGEGTVTIKSNRLASYTKIIVSIANTDRECIELIHARWPGAVRLSHVGTEKHRPAWEWRRQCALAEEFLRDIQPHIRSARVRAKIALALKVQRHRYGGQRPGRLRMDPEAYRQMHAGFKAEMHRLNQRGVVA